jgi:hypothetical protein
MSKKKKLPKSDDPEQSARFIETAERTKADNDKEKFEKACSAILKKKLPPPSQKS